MLWLLHGVLLLLWLLLGVCLGLWESQGRGLQHDGAVWKAQSSNWCDSLALPNMLPEC